MSLPALLKHIYNYGTEEVVRRGKKIFLTSGIQLLDVDYLIDQIRFRVRNDQYHNYYTVTIKNFSQHDNLSLRCQCPYNLGEICRHEVAALFHLNEMLQSGFFENVDVTYDQKHTVVRMRQVTPKLLQLFASATIMEQASSIAPKVIVTTAKDDKIEAEVPDEEHTYKVVLKQNDERYYDTSCSCDETAHPLCKHKTAVFLQVLQFYGPNYFQTMRNWDEQKNKLLRLYGYTLNDDLTNKFAFTYENGKPFLRVLDPSIKKVNAVTQPIAAINTDSTPNTKLRLGIVLDTHTDLFPYVKITLVAGEAEDKAELFTGAIQVLDLQQYQSPHRFLVADQELIPAIRKFTVMEVLKYLRKNLPFGDFIDDDASILRGSPAEETQDQVWEYLLPRYQKMLERFASHTLCFLRQGTMLSSKTLHPIVFSSDKLQPQLSVKQVGDEYEVNMDWYFAHTIFPFAETKVLNPALILHENTVYTVQDIAAIQLIDTFLPDGKLLVPSVDWEDFLNQNLLEWSKKVPVNFDEALMHYEEDLEPQYQLYLQELEQVMVFKPSFAYHDTSIAWGHHGDVIKARNGKVTIYKRNEVSEQKFINHLRYLHSDMQYNVRDKFFYLNAQSVLNNNWFFFFTEEMKEWKVELFGYEGLRNLRINTHKPKTQVRVSNGIDWFDAAVEVSFGDQVVNIAAIKKAVAQKSNYIRLGDGSIGLLPEEWLKKYSLLLKIGEAKDGKLRLKKYHFTALDEMLSEIDEEQLQQELEGKKERLNNIIEQDFSQLTIPEQVKATLRPYQSAGFQWLAFLNEAGWGGILADDMGLGKTIQTLTYLQHYKNIHGNVSFLVVCPTTLLYNWENEIKKFTPALTFGIHHGPKRTASIKLLLQNDITITTYGTLRSDIKMFSAHEFDYAVLDESQAIKNPQSQVAKASLLIQAKHKIALSGTPIQNNTFDLYAQMNFLNPGMLGSREFFNNEFAIPIDKFQEAETQKQLRKLTYPFLLRRTKEQVAKDLPSKTETILYCEMGKEQRKIYEGYRNLYKSSILDMIEEQGIERSQMHILQGLTKLRQICDSPAIIKQEEPYPNHSIKIEELTREIEENVGNHKALIFSQFIGMLSLIKAELEKHKIPYAYFDGSSTTQQREKAIQEFQQNESCRIFLISLKAGGIGLNLTAADYVYIVDPWWNPAVEQQAIDRTHRIGQTKSIFAYRLICKDTIEEKMMLLQERKRQLAKDLIADDNAILKRLNQEDIVYLLS